MKMRLFSVAVLGFGLALSLAAQDPSTLQDSTGQPPAQGRGPGQRGGWGGGMGMGGGRGIMGTVTESAADHYTIKTETGESYVVHFSANTRIMKQTVRHEGDNSGRMGPGGVPPLAIKASEIKVGDAVTVVGEPDAATKSIGAVIVLQMDPERAKQIHEMQANWGKTWLGGKVTGIKETTVTIEGMMDHAAHSFVVDENSTFRKRREPITLGDLQVGDLVRAEGAVKNGVFVAAMVQVQNMPQGDGPRVPRNGPPQQ
jgi:hypothetical protein